MRTFRRSVAPTHLILILIFTNRELSHFFSDLQHTFARELRETRAEEKGKVTLECETRHPAKRVTWLKGMVELRSGRKYVIRQRGVVLSLTINCLEKSDTDIYICDVGTMQSRAQLTVQGEIIVKGTLCVVWLQFRGLRLHSTGLNVEHIHIV